jgi:hypothetical protein
MPRSDDHFHPICMAVEQVINQFRVVVIFFVVGEPQVAPKKTALSRKGSRRYPAFHRHNSPLKMPRGIY